MNKIKYKYKNTCISKTCDIFKCSEISLKRWIEKYNNLGNIKRQINHDQRKLNLKKKEIVVK
jgi:transposase